MCEQSSAGDAMSRQALPRTSKTLPRTKRSNTGEHEIVRALPNEGDAASSHVNALNENDGPAFTWSGTIVDKPTCVENLNSTELSQCTKSNASRLESNAHDPKVGGIVPK